MISPVLCLVPPLFFIFWVVLFSSIASCIFFLFGVVVGLYHEPHVTQNLNVYRSVVLLVLMLPTFLLWLWFWSFLLCLQLRRGVVVVFLSKRNSFSCTFRRSVPLVGWVSCFFLYKTRHQLSLLLCLVHGFCLFNSSFAVSTKGQTSFKLFLCFIFFSSLPFATCNLPSFSCPDHVVLFGSIMCLFLFEPTFLEHPLSKK